MSSTNKTTYYNLPQFVDSDIFNPLVDDNDAYDKIDTALHDIAVAGAESASEIATIKGKMDTDETDISNLKAQNGSAVLTTTAQTLSEAINEINSETDAVAGRVNILDDDINNVSTGIKVKLATIETQNGNETLTTTAQTLSGAINELDGEVSTLDGDINDASTGLKAKVSALETQNGDSVLTTTSQTLSGAINEIDADTANLKIKTATPPYKKIIFVGDSYSGIRDASNKTMFEIAGELLDCPYTVAAQTGIGFTNINGQGTFLEYLQTVTTDRDSYTDIVVCGGCNDYDSISNEETAIKAFCDYVFANFVNAKVSLMHVGGYSDTRKRTHLSNSLPSYKGCGKFGAHYVANSEYIMYGTQCFNTDAVHPLSTMVDYIGAKIAEGVTNGFCNVQIYSNNTVTPVSSASFTVGTTYLPNWVTFINNGAIGMACGGYEIATISEIPASAYSNNEFDYKIIDGLDFFGFPSNWTTGQYAFPIVAVASNGNSYSGIAYANTDGSIALHISNIPSSVTSFHAVPLGQFTGDFDMTRGFSTVF